jgi:hypothetical protein
MLQPLLDLLSELPGLMSDRVQLLALEVRRAAQALARMVALAVAAALMLTTAWLAFWAGLAWAALQAGLPWGAVVVVVVAVNALAAWLALRVAVQLARLVALPATVRQLTVHASALSPEEGVLHAVAPE